MEKDTSAQKGSAFVVILIAFASLALGALGTYWYMKTQKPTATPVVQPQPTQLSKSAIAQKLFLPILKTSNQQILR